MAKSIAKKSTPKKAAQKKGSKTAIHQNTEPALLELFTDELKDIYWVQKTLVKALPKVQKAAATFAVKRGDRNSHRSNKRTCKQA